MFRIKICGITRPEDALAVASSGADAIGLNFCQQSPRFVSEDQARQIAEAADGSLAKVGVFVNATCREIDQLCGAVGLDWVQLHGDEPPEMLSELGAWKILRAFRLDERGLGPIADYLDACCAAGRMPDAVLVDAHIAGQYGGTGRTADWQSLANPNRDPASTESASGSATDDRLADGVDRGPADGVDRDWRRGLPLVLAGGLAPDNVAQAIRTVRPDAVDTSSGVESSPGVKDAERCKRFIGAAREALVELE